MACSNNGTLYAHVITSPTTPSQIYSVNKTTGVLQLFRKLLDLMQIIHREWVGTIQSDSGYLFAYNYTTSTGELRKIDIATGFTPNCSIVWKLMAVGDIRDFPGPQIFILHINIQQFNRTTYSKCNNISRRFGGKPTGLKYSGQEIILW